jgi:poly-gamma-glutamate synthesis protein (capsule biosynthesis protein)
LTEQPENAILRLEVGLGEVVSQWVYALVAPFPTVVDGVSAEDLRRSWRGNPSGPFAGRALLMDGDTQRVFSSLWGEPAGGAVQVRAADKLLAAAWEMRPSWALVPFEVLEPRWKVLSVDGLSPVRKDFNASDYALAVPISISGDQRYVSLYSQGIVPGGNRDAGKLTTLMMTGVTALVRATAWTMERQGIDYPALDVGEPLRQADLTHISNEVPFARDCPFPDPVQPDMRFCSDPRYITLLETVGTDVVELTGDHFGDWGTQAMLFTLELYDERNWPYYGGGANFIQGRRALTVEHNGNRLAFIGCNAKGGGFAGASATNPGAVACDFPWMHAEISRLREEGYLPIATFQHFEYYTYYALANQERDARGMAKAGAVIVSGSQAHQPQAFEFRDGTLIHYGLGNLFFDQLDVSEATRQAFIDRHVFYAGRHISTELLTIYFVDYARPRLMTVGERKHLLEAVFEASGW